ncbi:ABC transporter ATP-binding protein [Propionivibrio sp.]|uniref:ABC transporter ATP-binding protein n=1 Tax=Propionivibrio sp. TaxID=2212460 RepID=UPI0039E35E4D
MLNVNDLNVFYGNFEALHSVSLTIGAGEIVALLGANGAGKSTTINTISGLTELRGGTMTYDGADLAAMPAHERVARGVIQVPEGRKLFPFMTILDNLLIGSFSEGTRARRAETLEMVYELFPKLAERRNQLAGTLSGGEQQMCAVARGLMAQPKILMLDEPSLGLAPIMVETIFEAIVKINKLGTSILLVEQNVLYALEIANRGYVVETGRTVLQGTSAELSSNEELRKAYLGL